MTKFDPSAKTTHPDLISSDDHDMYVALKWSTLITIRGVNSFLQASADLAIAALSNDDSQQPNVGKEDEEDGVTVVLSSAPSSPYLIPSFVRVSYVSEENNKVNPEFAVLAFTGEICGFEPIINSIFLGCHRLPSGECTVISSIQQLGKSARIRLTCHGYQGAYQDLVA